MKRFVAFVQELQRRKVFKVGTIYVVTAWGLTLGAAELFPAFGAPEWTVRFFAVTSALGLPIALVLAWAFEVTPAGFERDLGRVPAADQAASLQRAPSATTALFGVHGVVRASWVDVHGAAQEHVADRAITLGRDEGCAIRFDDALVSRRHAEIGFADGAWCLTDLESRNGTFLDGQRVQRVALPPKAIVRLSEAGPAVVIEVRPHGLYRPHVATELS